MDDIDGNLLGRELDERIGKSFDGAIDIALDDDVEFLEATLFNATTNLIERQMVLGADALLALQLLSLGGNLTGFLVAVHNMESITCLGCTIQSENRGCFSRTDLLDTLSALVEHGLDATKVGTSQKDIAQVQGAVGAKHGGNITTPLVEGGLNNTTGSLTVGVGFEIEHLSFEQHLLHEFGHAHTFLGTDILTLILTAPILNEEVHLCQMFLDLLWVSGRFIYLIDCKDNGYACGHSVVDGFLGLRHDVVVGSNDDDGNVGDLSTTGTHSRESLVTRSIQEGDVAAILQLHVVGTDMLCDAARLTCDDIRLADIVEERGLTVVNMTHHGDNWSARHEVCFVISFLVNSLADIGTDIFRLVAEFIGHEVDGLLVHTLVDADHDTETHAGADDLCDGDIHHRCQFVGSNEFRQLQDLRLLFLLFEFSLDTSTDVLTLLAAVLGTLSESFVLTSREASQGLAHLLSNLFLALFRSEDWFLRLVLLATLAFALVLLVGLRLLAAASIAFVLLLLLRTLILLLGCFGSDINAFAFLLAAPSFCTFYTAALFALLTTRRTGTLVDGVEVDMSFDLKVQHGFGRGLHTVYTIDLLQFYGTLLFLLHRVGNLCQGLF